MKKLYLLAIAAFAAAAALAATATAKEITELKVCGSSGCASVDKAKLQGLVEDGGPVGPSVYNPRVGTYYKVSMSFGMNGDTLQTHETYWLPDRGLLRGQEQLSVEPWWTAPTAQTDLLKEAARGLQPFAPALRRVTVAGRAVADPSSYMRLLDRYPHPKVRPSKKARWIKITLRGTNPWVDGVMRMRYQPRRHVLQRENDLVKLPRALGQLVVRRLSLAPPATSGKANAASSGHVALYAGVSAAGLVAAGLALMLRRRAK